MKPISQVLVGNLFRHRKGGLYEVIAVGKIEATLEKAVVYKATDGNVWIRPATEFMDGRFQPVK